MQRLIWALLAAASTGVHAQACYKTSVMNPSPLMGNHGEVFKTQEGALFEVFGSYEYLYAYYPDVTICPSRGKMFVEGKTVNIRSLRASMPESNQSQVPKKKQDQSPPEVSRSKPPIEVVHRVRGCDYFLADGPRGLYLLQHYGGYDPSRGDGIYGEIRSYGFISVIYGNGSEGRLYVDDFMLGQDRAVEKLREKCP